MSQGACKHAEYVKRGGMQSWSFLSACKFAKLTGGKGQDAEAGEGTPGTTRKVVRSTAGCSGQQR